MDIFNFWKNHIGSLAYGVDEGGDITVGKATLQTVNQKIASHCMGMSDTGVEYCP